MTETDSASESGAVGTVVSGAARPRHRSMELTYDEAKRLCQYSLDIVCISNFKGEVLWSNNVDSLITGYSKEELSLITWHEITHPDDMHKVSESLKVISQGELRPCTEIRMRCKDGSYKWISWSGVPVIEENKIYAIGRDVTAQKIAEAEAKKLAAIVQSSSDAIVSIDDCGTITSWNRGAELLYGYRCDEMTGKPVHNLLLIEHDSCLLGSAVDLQEVDEVHSRSDGSAVEVNISLFPIIDEFGLASGKAAIIRDISKQKAAERCVAQFRSITSHELRTPLSSIRGVLGLLEGGLARTNSDEGRELIALAKSSCDRLVSLINDILDASRAENGLLQLNYQTLRCGEIIDEAAANTAAMARERNIKIIADQSSYSVRADRKRLVQVLTNLLSNAIKFSPDGSVVQIALTSLPGIIRFAVIDQGPGIPRHQHHDLFKQFRPLDASDARANGGVGLGLSIAKAIVEAHGGSIGLDCTNERGSTFWFELPYDPLIED